MLLWEAPYLSGPLEDACCYWSVAPLLSGPDLFEATNIGFWSLALLCSFAL